MNAHLTDENLNALLADQQSEINAYHIYLRIADCIDDDHNAQVIRHIAEDEHAHYQRIRSITKRDVEPNTLLVTLFYWLTRLMGLTFGLKLFEQIERNNVDNYQALSQQLAFMDDIVADEIRHERELLALIDEERLNYIGSVVLGLNDALVELTGALAGYTFAFQNSRLIALTGLITGISASFSMAASEYLATRHEGGDNALTSAVYTGVAYIFTVIFLTLPFLIIGNPFISLAVTLVVAVLIIFLFNYYISVAKDYNFKKRFFEMATISIGVAAISFLIGVLVKQFIGIEL